MWVESKDLRIRILLERAPRREKRVKKGKVPKRNLIREGTPTEKKVKLGKTKKNQNLPKTESGCPHSKMGPA